MNKKTQDRIDDLGLWVKTSGLSLCERQGALTHPSFPCFPAISGCFKTHIS